MDGVANQGGEDRSLFLGPKIPPTRAPSILYNKSKESPQKASKSQKEIME